MKPLCTRCVRVVLPVLALSFYGCGDDEEEDITTAPQAEPTAAGSPGPGLWARVHLERDDDVPIPGECAFPRNFRIQADGTFTAGPCARNSNVVKRGRLTEAELAEVDRRTDIVVQGNLAQPPECDTETSFSTTELRVTLPNRQVIPVYENSIEDSITCYRGGRGNVLSLLQFMNALEDKYYPTPRPTRTPSPSPAPTVTVTATPSPSPSPTVMPMPSPTPTPSVPVTTEADGDSLLSTQASARSGPEKKQIPSFLSMATSFTLRPVISF